MREKRGTTLRSCRNVFCLKLALVYPDAIKKEYYNDQTYQFYKNEKLPALVAHSLILYFVDQSKKLQVLLCSLPVDRLEESTRCLVWRTHLSVCLLAAERGQDFTSSLLPLTTALDSQYNLPLFRTYLDGVKDILDASPCFKVDHNILIGGMSNFKICQGFFSCRFSDTVICIKMCSKCAILLILPIL